MTPHEARHALYAAARAVDEYIPDGNLKEDALDVLDELREELWA